MQPMAGDDQLAQDLLKLVGAVMKTASVDALQVADEFELSLSQLKAMFIVNAAAEPLAVHELAAQIGLSVGAAGRAVEGLVRHGLVDRTEDPGDRRVKRVALTAVGTEAIDRIVASRREGIASLIAGLDESQRDQLALALVPLLEASTASEACAAAPAQLEGAAR